SAQGIRITGPSFGGFAENDLTHEDKKGSAPAWLGAGLRHAVLSYMEGEGLTKDVRRWFERSVPKPTVPRTWAARAMADRSMGDDPAAERMCVWIGGTPVVEPVGRKQCRVILPSRNEDTNLRLVHEQATWLTELIRGATPTRGARYPALKDVRAKYPADGSCGFDSMLHSVAWKQARAAGLLLV
ncbi:MAG: hypothetical protein L0219_12595, partial [Phycisphaerales bacterium]|nr:hypothetical protein [Phycisphaerales bacterium]